LSKLRIDEGVVNASLANSPVDRGEAASQADILQWIGEAGEALRGSRLRALLDVDGIDAFDVLLSPVYAAVLNTLRRGPAEPESTAGRALASVRRLGYRMKGALREKRAVRQAARPEPAEIVLWTRNDNHTAILEPVAAALARRGTSARVFACDAGIFQGIARKSETVYSMAAWPRIARDARREGARRARRLAALAPWDLPTMRHPHGAHLEPTVRTTVMQMLPLAAQAVANARTLLDRLKPRVLVVGNDLIIEGQAGCRVAAQRGVPTAMFTHGAIASEPLQSLHRANRILVRGRVVQRVLEEQGIEPERIVVCGAPNLDNRPRQTGRIHPALRSELDLRPDRPWILVATSGPGHVISHRHHEQVVAGLVRLSRALPDVPVVVKLHPKDRLAYYDAALQACRDTKLHVISIRDRRFPRDIFEWLNGCKLLLTGASAAAIEAMLMDVPVITMDYCGETAGVPFIEAGATMHVRSVEALEQAARKIVAGGMPDELRDRVRAHLQDSFCALDGGSAARGAEALCRLAAEGTKALQRRA
jgi:hypothetical protein